MNDVKRLSVPYIAQETPYFCGPACLSMVAKFYGLEHSQQEFAQLIETIHLYGTPCATMATLGRAIGLWAFESWHASSEDLRAFIDAGIPPIMYVQEKEALDQGFGELDLMHFYVVTGYGGGDFFIHDPDPSFDGGQEHGMLSEKELLERWRAEPGVTGRWMLALSPLPLDERFVGPRFTGKPHATPADTEAPPQI